MYPYGILWSHIGVLWIHVGYLLGPYGSTAPHWIHRNPCLTDVVSIWISCWIQFGFICTSAGHMSTTYGATLGIYKYIYIYIRMRLGLFKNEATCWMLQIRKQVEAHRCAFQPPCMFYFCYKSSIDSYVLGGRVRKLRSKRCIRNVRLDFNRFSMDLGGFFAHGFPLFHKFRTLRV